MSEAMSPGYETHDGNSDGAASLVTPDIAQNSPHYGPPTPRKSLTGGMALGQDGSERLFWAIKIDQVALIS